MKVIHDRKQIDLARAVSRPISATCARTCSGEFAGTYLMPDGAYFEEWISFGIPMMVLFENESEWSKEINKPMGIKTSREW